MDDQYLSAGTATYWSAGVPWWSDLHIHRRSVASTQGRTASTSSSQFVRGVEAVEGVEANLQHPASQRRLQKVNQGITRLRCESKGLYGDAANLDDKSPEQP